MKNKCGLLFLALFFSICIQVNAQVTIDDLSKHLAPSMTVKEIKQEISKAEKIYKTQKKQSSGNQEELAKTTLNFALFRKQVFEILNQSLYSPSFKRQGFVKLYEENAAELAELLEEVINLYEKSLKIENYQLATAKFELANSLENYKLVSIGSNKQKKTFGGIRGIQKLYLEASEFFEKSLGTNHERTLVSGYYLANSYLRTGDFDKSLPLYEKYISGVEKNFGKESEYLLPVLRITSVIWQMIGREDHARKLNEQITRISKKDEGLSGMLLSLQPRAKSTKYKGIKQKLGKFTNSGSLVVLVNRDNPLERRTLDGSNTVLLGGNQPYYTIPKAGKFKRAQIISVNVTVDTEGKVTEAKAETPDSEIKAMVETEVKNWEFKPFIYNGQKMTMTGIVYYYY